MSRMSIAVGTLIALLNTLGWLWMITQKQWIEGGSRPSDTNCSSSRP